MSKLLLFNKPFGVLSQFTGEEDQKTLSSYIFQKKFYAAGRLDKDSEGLLLLTNDGKLQQRIADPAFNIGKTYIAQVDGLITDAAIDKLQSGIKLKEGITQPAQASKIDEPATLWKREPPIRFRENIPTSWLKITLYEGKNRQVRRMTAAAGFPTLRLVRIAIGSWNLNDLEPGHYLECEV